MAATTISKLLPAFGTAMVVYHPGTAEHCERVAALARRLGAELGLDPVQLEVMHWAGMLHDIGKLAVPEEILTKSGRLTAEEWLVVQRHPSVGSALLLTLSPGLAPVAAGVRSHHERWDGTGYPDCLAGVDIPLTGRIVSVADVYDALTHQRTYRDSAFTSAAATQFIVNAAGHQFDPELVDAFQRVRGEAAPVPG